MAPLRKMVAILKATMPLSQQSAGLFLLPISGGAEYLT
jgi:hypothetical protein